VQVVLYSKIPIDALKAHDLPTKRVVAVAEAFGPFLSIVVRVNRFHGRTVSMDGLFEDGLFEDGLSEDGLFRE
jgi:hypothetical protein